MLFKNLKGSTKICRGRCIERAGQSWLSLCPATLSGINSVCAQDSRPWNAPGWTAELGVREFVEFFNCFPSKSIVDSCRPPKLILGALQNILFEWKSLLYHTRFWNLLKHQLQKHGLGMSPELLLGTCREPACPGENGCSQKAKEKRGKMEICEDTWGTVPVHPIQGRALSGELQLEAGGTQPATAMRINSIVRAIHVTQLSSSLAAAAAIAPSLLPAISDTAFPVRGFSSCHVDQAPAQISVCGTLCE